MTEGQEFSSLYEKSKAAAEILVRDSGLPWTICRLGMIIGDSKTGRVKNFNTIYYILKLMLTGKMSVLPVEKDLGLNLVSVDYVAEATAKISLAEESEGKIYHLTCPLEMQPKAEEPRARRNKEIKERACPLRSREHAETRQPRQERARCGAASTQEQANQEKGSCR